VLHSKNLPFVKHHQEAYGGHFPIWAAVELMTFGNIASLLIKRMLHSNEQWESFLKDIDKTINKYKDVIILSFIGFPSNWYDVLSEPVTGI